MPCDSHAAANRLLRLSTGLVALLSLAVLTGCQSLLTSKESYIGKANLNYYVDRAASVASPAIVTRAEENIATLPPHTIADRSHDTVRDISLGESIHLALSNSKVIRQQGTFLSPNNSLLTNPEFVPSIYDPALQETNTSFGNRGVEAALADFDASLSSQLIWGREEQLQNSLFGFGQQPGQTLQQDTAEFVSRIEKPFATGSVLSVSHGVDYDYNNATSRMFPSAYQGNVAAEFRHPLLSGSGLEFNRVAGPQSRTTGRGAQFTNGVLIARIKSDIAVAEFQQASRNLVREVEQTYWNLVLAYRVYHANVVARNSALATWRMVKARSEQGLTGGGSADLAQAHDSYLQARARAESSQAELYRRELELRRIAGLPVNDGTILRPVDKPTTSRLVPDWYTALCEALTRRSELRRQKWRIKSLGLQIAAAKNFARPSLDFVSRYRVNGMGDKLLTGDDNDEAGTAQGLDSFYNNVLEGDQTGWNVGFEFTMPIGLRAAKSQVRWYELRLAKARATLSTMEHEVSHELAAAFQDLSRYYQTAQTNFNRRAAAARRLEAYETRYELGGAGAGENQTAYLDLLLRSQISLAQADAAYWESIIAYNQAIADVHLRQGTLLERYGISLAEGRWQPGAYRQALSEAWARSHAFSNPLLDSIPDEFARPGEVVPTAIPKLAEPASVTPIPVVPPTDPPGPDATPVPPAPSQPDKAHPNDTPAQIPAPPMQPDAALDRTVIPTEVSHPNHAGWHAVTAPRPAEPGPYPDATPVRLAPRPTPSDGWRAVVP